MESQGSPTNVAALDRHVVTRCGGNRRHPYELQIAAGLCACKCHRRSQIHVLAPRSDEAQVWTHDNPQPVTTAGTSGWNCPNMLYPGSRAVGTSCHEMQAHSVKPYYGIVCHPYTQYHTYIWTLSGSRLISASQNDALMPPTLSHQHQVGPGVGEKARSSSTRNTAMEPV
jgi:hypothetical protein